MDIPPVIPFPTRREPDDFMSGYWEGLGDGYQLCEKAFTRTRIRWITIAASVGILTGIILGILIPISAV